MFGVDPYIRAVHPLFGSIPSRQEKWVIGIVSHISAIPDQGDPIFRLVQIEPEIVGVVSGPNEGLWFGDNGRSTIVISGWSSLSFRLEFLGKKYLGTSFVFFIGVILVFLSLVNISLFLNLQSL